MKTNALSSAEAKRSLNILSLAFNASTALPRATASPSSDMVDMDRMLPDTVPVLRSMSAVGLLDCITIDIPWSYCDRKSASMQSYLAFYLLHIV